MDDGREMKEKAQRLNDNYNEIFKYVANADRKNSDVFQKGVIPKNHIGATDNVQDDSKDVDMTDLTEVKELNISQTMDPLRSNSNEDHSEDDYIANWEEDVSDPLEMLMISKDPEQLGHVRPESKNIQRGQYNPGRRGFQRGKRSSHQNFNRSSSNYSRPRNYHHDSYSGSNNFWDDNYDFSANSSEVFYYQRRSKYNRGRKTGPWKDVDEQSVGPSDSASQMCERSSVSQNSHDSGVSTTDLTQALSELENFSASLLTLIDKYDFDHKEVKRTVKNNSNTFELKDEIVYLRPKFRICESHIQSTGCINGNECSELHICPQFITDLCNLKNCLMGHFWKTNHNLKILNTHSIASLQIPTLNKLFLSSSSSTTQNAPKNLQICFDYNSGKCQKDNCNELHLCLAFLAKLCTPQDNCPLHHNPLHKEVSPILVHHGISTNESPKDILLSIMESPLIRQETNKFKAGGDSGIRFDVTHNSTLSTEKNIIDDKPSTSKDAGISQRSEIKETTDTVRKAKTTTWSHNFLGEVKIPEICYYSVESYCKHEDTGCLRLHSFQHFHWQVCETGKPWVNLRDFQALAIEKAFCDPQISKVDVPPLDPSKLDPLIKPLLITMQGKSLWKADFETMQLVLNKVDNQQTSKQSGNLPTALKLRRLCTEYIPNQVPKACIFSWYFLDKNKKWVQYGLVDSTGDTNLICDVTSTDIEKHHRERPNSPLPFMSSRFTYIIDTVHCVQLNLDTNVSRSVRRRPSHHLK